MDDELYEDDIPEMEEGLPWHGPLDGSLDLTLEDGTRSLGRIPLADFLKTLEDELSEYAREAKVRTVTSYEVHVSIEVRGKYREIGGKYMQLEDTRVYVLPPHDIPENAETISFYGTIKELPDK